MGRNKIEVNWDKVEKMGMAGSNGKQIASALGIHYDTLANACKREYKTDFSAYLLTKREKGNNFLFAKQYDLAMRGDRGMLIWLGKNRLGQSDKKEIEYKEEVQEEFDLSKLSDDELRQYINLTNKCR